MSGIIDKLKIIFQASPATSDTIAWDAWVADQEIMADKVAQARRYADGEHQLKMTEDMRKMLRLEGSGDNSPFTINHCENLIATPTDRLELTSFEADTPEGTAWVESLKEANSFDGLQIDVAEATITDGNSYVLIEFDNDTGETLLTHEPAFDGIEGMIVLYAGRQRDPLAAVKVWNENGSEGKTVKLVTRVNVYWPDRVEKYVIDSDNFQRYEPLNEPWPAPWRTATGQPLGVPVFHFRHNSRRHHAYGMSILENVIPIQNSINRVSMSKTAMSELNAFPIRYSFGYKPPAAIQPGMMLYLAPGADASGKMTVPDESLANYYRSIQIGSLSQGQIAPYLEQLRFLIEQMYIITRTPMNWRDAANPSGESLKQLEAGLLGRLRRLQVNLGESWEKVMKAANLVQRTFGEAAAEVRKVKAMWKPAEVRNDAQVIANAKLVENWIDQKTRLELVGPVFGWDGKKIDEIIAGLTQDSLGRLAALGARGGAVAPSGVSDDDELDFSFLIGERELEETT